MQAHNNVLHGLSAKPIAAFVTTFCKAEEKLAFAGTLVTPTPRVVVSQQLKEQILISA
jgi:hypothetical protein